ncbi:MAG: hypothetical protein NT031_06425, partial [Planctomycetota bacterium]|nr:hypothetical protein [Planctomycetota bacterium]
MKTSLLTPVIVLASVAFLAVGCCDPNEFKKLQELNREASAENQRLSNSNTDLQREATSLRAQLQQYSGVTEGNQSAFQKLQERNGQLTSEVDALRRKFKELQDGGVVVLEGTMPAEMSSALKGLADSNGDLIEFLPKYGMIKFKADLTFELGSDNVQAKAGQALAKLAS